MARTTPLSVNYTVLKSALDQRFLILNSSVNKIIFISLVTVISLLFMYTFVPFNINRWYEDASKFDLFKIFSIFSLAGTFTLLLTQFGLRKWLRIEYLTYGQYFFWFLGEILILTFGIMGCDWLLNNHPDLSVSNYLDTFNYTILIAIPPYVISLLILFGAQQYKLAHNLSLVATEHKALSDNLLIGDENGKIILTLHPNNVLFFKSEDNYVDVHYLLGGEVKTELIRTTLKKIESTCSYSGLIRVHRSYTINIKTVSSSKKTHKGYVLQFDPLPDLQIPVSASHQKQFEQYLSSTSSTFPFTPL
ncbi:LytTR family transcriptional regulator [Pedobacter panaciterrae]|uniref:LytTR family DNA-binding domain-containing protein n=1 Tax=Pedobacter panaciterrae TaxID=363849 RepID=UPI00155DB7D1|nr:LytTR family DNA-binding domain-containing protein [Pedobacter panaciterrae]NQX54246.1 LytTR family transcriptional regulator [Pedobacter panaciterrae]